MTTPVSDPSTRYPIASKYDSLQSYNRAHRAVRATLPPHPARHVVPDEPTPWLLYAVVVTVLVLLVGYGLYTVNANYLTAKRQAASYVCGLTYRQYSTEWQNCVDASMAR